MLHCNLELSPSVLNSNILVRKTLEREEKGKEMMMIHDDLPGMTGLGHVCHVKA